MTSRTALSNVLLAFESLIQNVEDDGTRSRARIAERIIAGKITSGDGASEANRAFFDEYPISNGSRIDVNLANPAKDAIGLRLRLQDIAFLAIKHTGTAGRIEIQKSSPANALSWAPRLTVANNGALRPGGLVMIYGPDDENLPIEDGADCQIRLDATGGNVTAQIWMLARDEEVSETSSSSSRSSSSSSQTESSQSSSSSSESSSSSSLSESSLSSSTSSSSLSTASSQSSSSAAFLLALTTTGTAITFSMTQTSAVSQTCYWDDGATTVSTAGHAHTFSPSNPPQGCYINFAGTGATPTVLSCRSQNLTQFAIPPQATGLTSVTGDGNNGLVSFPTSAAWTALQELKLYNNAALSDITLRPEWTALQTLWLYNTAIGNITLPAGLTSLTDLRMYLTSQSGVRTIPSDWTALEYVQLTQNAGVTEWVIPNTLVNMTFCSLGQCGLTALTTHPEWTALQTFSCQINFGLGSAIGTMPTHKEWVALTAISFDRCSFTDVKIHPEWVNIASVSAFSNQFAAGVIDQMLIDLDATGASNGTFQYHNNPGSADGLRSAGALTAMANLVGKGWTLKSV